MKKALLFLTAVLFIHQFSYTQTPWTYRECVSGVSTNLTSASVNISFYSSYAVVCGSGGVVLKTTNSGTNWINVSGGGLPSNIDLTTVCYIAPDTFVTAGNTGTMTYLYRTVNGGANWTQVFSQANGFINSIMFKETVLGYMTGNPVGGRWSLWRSTNKGLTWDSSGLYIAQAGSETGFPNSLTFRHNYVLFGTNNSRIYRSTNSGFNWSFIFTPEVNSTNLWVNGDTSAFPPPGYAFIYSGGYKLYKTTNIGVNWTQTVFPDSASSFVGFCPGVPGVDNAPYYVFAAKNNNKIYFSSYGGGSFTAMYTAPAGTYNHMSSDFGPYTSPGYSLAVRTNGGITRVDYFLGGGIKQLSGLIPGAFELKQNYPNPFNPYTYIRFAVKKYGVVKLTVYNSAGEEVYEPVNELMKPGTYEVSWDASRFASGVYFYRMVTDGFMQTNKMILVK